MPRFKVVIEYNGKRSYVYDDPEVRTAEDAGKEAEKFFECGPYEGGLVPNSCFDVSSPDYVEDENEIMEENITSITVTELQDEKPEES